MQLVSFSEYKQLVAKEMQAERYALTTIHGANFTECLRISKLEESIQCLDKKGNPVHIHGKDIYNSATWNKFLTSINQPPDICQLTDVVDALTEEYIQWLTHKYTERYQCIKLPEHLTWLKNVARLAVRRHIMENKYAAYVQGNQEAFADETVGYHMTLLMMLQEAIQGAAKSINHTYRIEGKKEETSPENLKELRDNLLVEWFSEHYQRIKQVPFPPTTSSLQIPTSEGN